MIKKVLYILLLFCHVSFGQLLKFNDTYFNFKISSISNPEEEDTLMVQFYSYSYSNDTLLDDYGNHAVFSGDTINFPSELSIFNKADTNIWHTNLIDTFNNAYQWLWEEIQIPYFSARLKGFDNCFRLFVSGDSIKNSQILLFGENKEDNYHDYTSLINGDYPFLYFRVDTSLDVPFLFSQIYLWNDTDTINIFWDDGDVDTITNTEHVANHTYVNDNLQPYIKIIGDLDSLKKIQVQQTNAIGHANDANIELYENTPNCQYYYMFRVGHHGNVYYLNNNDSIVNFYLDNSRNYLGQTIEGNVKHISMLPKMEDFVITDCTELYDTIEFYDYSQIYWLHNISTNCYFPLDSLYLMTGLGISAHFYFEVENSNVYGDVSNYIYLDTTDFRQILLRNCTLPTGNIGVFNRFNKLWKIDLRDNQLSGNLDTLLNKTSTITYIDISASNSEIIYDLGHLATTQDSIKLFTSQYNTNFTYTSPGGWGWNNISLYMRACGIVASDIDQICIDLDNGGAINGDINIQNNEAPSAASATARSNLEGKGWTINFGSWWIILIIILSFYKTKIKIKQN